MRTAYTPGLKISPFMTVRTTRRLPLKGRVVVDRGEAVEPSTVVARAELPGILHTVKVAARMNLEPEEVKNALVVRIGDAVTAGQVIAQTRALFGLLKSSCESPVAGTVEMISEISGNVGVRAAAQPIELTAYLKGTVVEVIPGEGVAIEAEGAYLQGIFGVGGERQGTIRVRTDSPGQDLTPDRIGEDCRGAVVVGGRMATRDAVERAAAVGAAAIVSGGIRDTDLIDFLGFDIGVAITGQEDIPLTLLVTEGFGTIPMAGRTFDLFRALEGRLASVNGRTQIRAGVIRPEVIVPLSPGERPDIPPEPARQDLDAGAAIRLIRQPYFGRLGRVVDLPPALVKVPSGAEVRVLVAKLDDGESVTVPRANVEIVSG